MSAKHIKVKIEVQFYYKYLSSGCKCSLRNNNHDKYLGSLGSVCTSPLPKPFESAQSHPKTRKKGKNELTQET